MLNQFKLLSINDAKINTINAGMLFYFSWFHPETHSALSNGNIHCIIVLLMHKGNRDIFKLLSNPILMEKRIQIQSKNSFSFPVFVIDPIIKYLSIRIQFGSIHGISNQYWYVLNIMPKTHLTLSNGHINYIIVFLFHRAIMWYGQIVSKSNIKGDSIQKTDVCQQTSDDRRSSIILWCS